MKKFVIIKNNKVKNILISDSIDNIAPSLNYEETCEEYIPDIHPWGPFGEVDIEIGLDWKERYKQKIGYCIFCGDGLQQELIDSEADNLEPIC